MEEMKTLIDKKGRRLVIITDPHIKIDEDYFVYNEGIQLDMTANDDHSINSIFVKDKLMQPFEGYCWPGPSHYIDFLNEGASSFWGSLYGYE